MTKPQIPIDEYDYTLPEARIASEPLPERDRAQLLCWSHGAIGDYRFNDLPELLQESDVLVLNNTRVIQARLHFQTKSGAHIEILCLEPAAGHLPGSQSMNTTNKARWKCLVGNARKWKDEDLKLEIKAKKGLVILAARNAGRSGDAFEIKFSWQPGHWSFEQVLEACGHMPLPPYIKRPDMEHDRERYQTVFGRLAGSVAAPTASLHFTPNLLQQVTDKGIEVLHLTLHVGAGTFKPVTAAHIEKHTMHGEHFEIDFAELERLTDLVAKKRIVAAGTTCARTLETLYWLGVKALEQKLESQLPWQLGQWECYELPSHYTVSASFDSLLKHARLHATGTLSGYTSLLIAPGYSFRVIGGLITNFHQPRSTLLLLVAAFTEGGWRGIYEHALTHGYRFLSYGDTSLLLRT